MTLTDQLIESVRSAAKVNRSLMVAPAAILWTDADRIWESTVLLLANQLPELFVLGTYQPDKRQGTSIWLKCVVAGKLGTQLPDGVVPILYLPGISRGDLRAIETCPRELQPLAELQYRGVFPVEAASSRFGMRQDGASTDGVCTVFVDGLRYDVAMQLKAKLVGFGKVTSSTMWTCMPSVTASGKAWASPVAQWVSGKKADADFEPSVAADGKPLSTHNFRKLLTDHGFQVLDKHENGDPSANGCKAWVECGDLDHFGHEHGLRLARDIDNQGRH